jgi:hypothetical protein
MPQLGLAPVHQQLLLASRSRSRQQLVPKPPSQLDQLLHHLTLHSQVVLAVPPSPPSKQVLHHLTLQSQVVLAVPVAEVVQAAR